MTQLLVLILGDLVVCIGILKLYVLVEVLYFWEALESAKEIYTSSVCISGYSLYGEVGQTWFVFSVMLEAAGRPESSVYNGGTLIG